MPCPAGLPEYQPESRMAAAAATLIDSTRGEIAIETGSARRRSSSDTPLPSLPRISAPPGGSDRSRVSSERTAAKRRKPCSLARS